MARAVMYADDGTILQLIEGAEENIFATSVMSGEDVLPIPEGPLFRDYYLDNTHRVVGGAIVEE